MSTNIASVSTGSGQIITSNKMPRMYDLSSMIQMGINPKTGLPVKMGNQNKCELKDNMKRQIREMDLETAVNRYEWENLPKGLNANLMERLLYYRGQGVFFKIKDRYFFLPYALNGTPDVYGRWTSITPLTWGGPNIKEGEKEKVFIPGLIRNVIYDERDFEEGMNAEDCAVILQDRSAQFNTAQVSARQIVNEPLLDLMAECFPYARTALIAGCGIKGMRVEDMDQKNQVLDANSSILNAALSGQLYIPITAPVELQEFNNSAIAKSEEYMSAYQSLNNYRLSLYGLENGGVYQKKAHLLQTEQEMNGGCTNLIMEDGLLKRKEAADLFNKIFGESISVKVRESDCETNIGSIEGGDDERMVPGSNDTAV